MSLWEALELADPDPLGQRWARAVRSGRVYVAVRDPAGRVIVETKHREHGRTLACRIPEPPTGLCWVAVRHE